MIPNSSFVNCVLQNNVPHTGTHPHLHNLPWQKGVCKYGSVKDMRCSRLPHWAGDKSIRRGKGHMREAEVTEIWRYHPVSLENGSKEGRKLVDHNSHKKLAPSRIKATVSWCILLSLGKKNHSLSGCFTDSALWLWTPPPHLEENVQAKLHRSVTAERSQGLEEVSPTHGWDQSRQKYVRLSCL